MSWSNIFKGSIDQVKQAVAEYTAPLPEWEQGVFERGKAALADELSHEAGREKATGFVSATYNGHGYESDAGMTVSYSLSVSRATEASVTT